MAVRCGIELEGKDERKHTVNAAAYWLDQSA